MWNQDICEKLQPGCVGKARGGLLGESCFWIDFWQREVSRSDLCAFETCAKSKGEGRRQTNDLSTQLLLGLDDQQEWLLPKPGCRGPSHTHAEASRGQRMCNRIQMRLGQFVSIE